ncbi:velvet factor-domain-containing protein [Pilobolus umbonatus]|nr:velvet factor-domain-containing protein [Pilobolus umbonatus]
MIWKYIHQYNNWFDSLVSQHTPQPIQRSLLQTQWIRLTILFYTIFCILVTVIHFTSWLTDAPFTVSPSTDVYQRTYDPDESYSSLNNMSHGLKMSKLFSSSHYKATEQMYPFWQKAGTVPDQSDVTITTIVTIDTWTDLKSLASRWGGPISAVLHLSDSVHNSVLADLERDYDETPQLVENVDVHLVKTPGLRPVSVMLPINAQRNFARVLSRTDHVFEVESNIWIATDLHQTLIDNRPIFNDLMERGDMIVVPVFRHEDDLLTKENAPHTKNELLELIEQDDKMGLYDTNFEINTGPTQFDTWRAANDLYKVEEYNMQYEPLVIQSKTVATWCSERFIDRKNACLLSNYLAGNDFLVLPNDYAIYTAPTKALSVSELDSVIEQRLYAKYYWEQCVYHGRQLDAMGLWNTYKSNHIREQCSRVIFNWGKGLIVHNSDNSNHSMSVDHKSMGYDEREKRIYELVVCQQPLHARMCGFGEKDRRPIDPPPIVQLIVKQLGQDTPIDIELLQIPFFVLHVTLWSEDKKEERNVISNPPKCTRVLMGSLVSSPSLLKNTKGEHGLYFAFPDLSIRTEGRYTLRFNLIKLVNSDFQEDAKSKIVTQVFSNPFTVYSAKKSQLNCPRCLRNRG